MSHSIKRLFDLVLSLFLVVLLLPLLVLLCAVIYVNMGSPVLFRQQRSGLLGRPFSLSKFRTMNNNTDADGRLLADEDRLTALGRLLRRTSLDELPQLFNIIRGDMSLVGPRPLLIEHLDFDDGEYMRRHEVRPGITGWAQVNGRNAISWEEKFELDIWYVDNRSMLLDLKIILLTVIKVIKGEGINRPDPDTGA